MTAPLEYKLLQHLMYIRDEVMYETLLDLLKAY